MPQEWEWDEQKHKHFRQLGRGTIEYAPTITINGIEIENIGDNLQRQHEATKQANTTEQHHETEKICPFFHAPSLYHNCKTDCALYRANRCALKGVAATQDTQGKPCPFLSRCAPKCALYDQGCTLQRKEV